MGTEVHSLAEAWAPDQSLYECSTELPADYTPTSQEQTAADAYEKAAGKPTYGTSLEALLGLCAAGGHSAESLMGVEHSLMTNALKICPKAPHAAQMRLVLAGDVFLDGSNSVGSDIKAGTYRTEPGVHDCYWERTTDGGGTIANDFVTFAPKGVTVTIRKSDGGFTSTDCGVWKRVR